MERIRLEIERKSNNDFATTLAKLKAAGEARNFPTVMEIDVQARIVGKGMECEPTTVVGLCNAGHAKRILDEDLRVACQLPCRVAVLERAGVVTVSAMDALALAELFTGPSIREVSESIAATFEEILTEACS